MKKSFLVVLLGALPVCSTVVAGDGGSVTVPGSGEWQRYVDRLAPIGDRLLAKMADPQDELQRKELYSRLFSALSQANSGMVLGDVAHPDFWPIFNGAHNFGAPNPDGVYYLAPLDGKGVYRISGFRGTVRLSDFQIGGGLFYPRALGPVAPSFNNYDLDGVRIDAQGMFEVVLSSERPAGYQGDWWYIDPKSTYVMVRQWSYDWLHEVDGRFAIERLDTPAIKPRRSSVELDADLLHMAAWAEHATEVSMGIANRYRQEGLVNKVAVRDLSKIGGFANHKQAYIEGGFDIAEDEALIYETELPQQCRYWGVQLTDLLTWGAIDYVNRQSSLNGFTARLDDDGKFRAVIATTDPGVPNWLDTGGYRKGTIFGRWTECDSQPTPTITKVKLADLRKHLPPGTPTVSAEERDTALRLRRKGAQLRRRW